MPGLTPIYRYRCRLLYIHDGDTLDVEVDLGFRVHVRTPVRLLGLNAPELSTPEGREALAWVSQWMARRSSKGTTTARGYGADHQAQRRQALAALVPGQPCPRCGHGMWQVQALDLDHTDDRSRYLGLAHAKCNRAAGARKGNRMRGLRRRGQTALSPTAPLITSRRW